MILRPPCRALRCLVASLALFAAVFAEDGEARPRRARTKPDAPEGAHRFKVEADESVASQLNDPTSFLREARIDMALEHSTGRDHTLFEWTPTLALPLSERLRFEGGIPLLFNGPADRNELELGDIFVSTSYIFHQSEKFSALADVRIDLPTGNERFGAGLNVTQWHLSLGSVYYGFEENHILVIPFVEYRRSIFGGRGKPAADNLLGSVGVVYLWSEDAYLRGDWTLNFDAKSRWNSAGLLNLEAGRVFGGHYAVSVGYEFDLWGDAEMRNQASLSIGYLF
jgi:hypothetical protein